jgi:hypothetical protein
MNNTETCLNCTEPYIQCQFNYYHQYYCTAPECKAVSKKSSQKKWYKKTRLIEIQALIHYEKRPSKSSLDIGTLEEKLAHTEMEIIKLRDVASSLHSSIYDLLSITLGVMLHLTGDDASEISPEIIGSRCKKFYLLTQDVLKRPDLMLTTIWDCINNVQKTHHPGAPPANTS